MASVENRIVQMQFDNAAFERKMSDTIRNLQKLDSTIANAGAKNGLDKIAQSSKGFHLGGMTTAIEGVSKKFLALSTVGITVLATLTSRALSSGTQLVKALTLQPVIDGFREYEQQIGSIQTILSNTKADNTNLKQVNDALDVLNEYSDKTIYNFGEMTRNIGTFTAAGVDLDTSVQSIKGIANLAAISGSSSQQASTAMYQLSQAIASGSVKLMDWNSVVNAGMGGKVFQKALFDTGVAMGKIKDVPMGTTFQEWTDAGNSFRGSLQEGWLTSEVLTSTLSAFTGEMTEAQLTAIGFTKEQAKEMMELGKTGVEAATKVRTFTQLISTAKEALGSGWSQSFRTIFGDFEEATKLWTNVSDAIGGVITKNADARNKMLKTWDELGGRTKLINGIRIAFKALGEIFAPIKEAFREIFPATTGRQLFQMTRGFKQFAQSMRPSGEMVEKLKSIFTGFFAALEIGWTVLKEGVKFVADLVKELFNFGSGGFSETLANIGDFITSLHEMLVTEGGIRAFFDKLRDAAKAPIEFIQALVKTVREFFKALGRGGADAASESVERLGDRFSGLKDIMGRLGDIWEPFKKALGGVGKTLDKAWGPIRDWFKELGNKLADVMEPGDYDKALDTFNTAFLGGIVLLLKKFLSSGININLGGGVLDKITDTFGELTGVLKAMQTDLKAKALLKIAAALGVLVVSLVLLATINSDDLTRSMTAMAIGFGQLIAVFALLNVATVGPTSAAKLTVLASGMILLSTAMLVLSVAVKSLSKLSWDEMLKGLTGVAGMMLILSVGTLLLTKSSGGMILVGTGLMIVAVAMNILAVAVKQFADMEWSEMAKGMVGLAGGLLIIAAAMNLMPLTMPLIGAGLLLVAVSLPILAAAVKLLAKMSWSEIGRGMAALAGGLLIIAAAMNLMPPTMPLIGAGLILVSGALVVIAEALQAFGDMDWGEIVRGLAGMAGALLILAAASYAMSGSILGAVGIGLLSVALLGLFQVVKQFAGIDTGDLVKGLLGMAAAFAVIGVAAALLTPVIPMMLALGAALILIGAGFALFGLGATAVAKALEVLGKAGKAGLEAVISLIDALIERIPEIAKSAARGIMSFVKELLEGTPVIVKALAVLLGHLLDTIIELAPKAAKAVGVIITEMLKLIRDKVPEYVRTGFEVLMAFLHGLRANIGEITRTVADIITRFLDALAEKTPQIIDSVFNLIQAVFVGVVKKLAKAHLILFEKGLEVILGLLNGMKKKLPAVTNWFEALPGKILRWIGNVIRTLWNKGVDIIQGFLNGITKKAPAVINWFEALPGRIFRWIGNVARTIFSKGIDIIQGFINGVVQKATAVTNWFNALPGRIFRWIGGVLGTIRSKGVDIVQGFLNGVVAKALAVTNFFVVLPGRIANWVGSTLKTLWDKGYNLLVGLINGVVSIWNNTISPWFSGLASRVASAVPGMLNTLYQTGLDILQGLWNGLVDKWNSIWSWIQDKINMIPGIFRGVLGLSSPSKVMRYFGRMTMLGFGMGLEDNGDLPDKIIQNMTYGLIDSMQKMARELENVDEFNPTITPVLDLTRVQSDAKAIESLIPTASITPDYSYSQARLIASTRTPVDESTSVKQPSGDVNFEQNIYAPKQLSTGDIYRQTRNQITMAKEELAIP